MKKLSLSSVLCKVRARAAACITSGKTPGIVYGAGAETQLVELDHNALWHALKKEVFHSSILDLEVGGKSQQVLLRDVQYHPFRQLVLHVDFQRVDAPKKLHTKVPLHFMNQEVEPGGQAGERGDRARHQ